VHTETALLLESLMVAIEKMPGWTRVAEIVLGLISLVTGIWVLAYPGLAVLSLILLLSIGLIFLGWRDVVVGVMAKFLPIWVRAADIVFGILAFVLSAVVIFSPSVAVTTLVVLLYFALFVRGVAAVSMAGAARMLPPRLRIASAAVGVLSIVLALVFLVFPGLAIGTLILLLSIGLVFVGVEAIAAGVFGREIVPLLGSVQRKI
jgi:uncharacterized membrane protein HdeD (DUF308 family)